MESQRIKLSICLTMMLPSLVRTLSQTHFSTNQQLPVLQVSMSTKDAKLITREKTLLLRISSKFLPETSLLEVKSSSLPKIQRSSSTLLIMEHQVSLEPQLENISMPMISTKLLKPCMKPKCTSK